MKYIFPVLMLFIISVIAANWVYKRHTAQALQNMVAKQSSGRKPAEADIAKFLAPYESRLTSTRKSFVKIELAPMVVDDPLASKLGGMAYWPQGQEFPKSSTGKPMFLLAQIRLDEMSAMAGYPNTGMLQFFIADDDYYGANFEGNFSLEQLSRQKNFRVIYWPSLQQATQTYVVGHSDSLPHSPQKPRRMKFSVQEALLSDSDFRFDNIFGGNYYEALEKYASSHQLNSDDLYEAISERHSGSGHKIGGYPFFTQEDPRTEDGLELLFQLDSDDEMMWGDAGVAGFFISPEDLKRLDFSHVVYNWDCY